MESIKSFAAGALVLLVIGAVIIGALVGLIAGFQKFKVYSAEQTGKAELARASSNRQIAVLEAQALKDSSTLKAEAEVERAKGVAQANAIIGDSLKGNEDYLRYLYINNLADSHDQIIYIPTEAGLPILEANRNNGVAK